MFVKGAKFPKWGPNFLGNLAPRGPYFLGNLSRGGGQIFGGAKFPVTPGAHKTILAVRFLSTDQIVTCAASILRDFSRPIEIGQYQTVLILHRHVNRLKWPTKIGSCVPGLNLY